MDGMQTETYVDAKPRKRTRRHSRKLKILVVTTLVIVGIYAGLVIHDKMTHGTHPLYDAALEKVQSSDVVKSELGNDIEAASPDKSVVEGAIAEFEFFIEGPLGIATVATKGKKVDGDWVPTALNVEFLDGRQHNLLR